MGILTLDLLTFVVAGIASALVTNFIETLILRIIVGIGVGIDYVVVFTYVAEIEHRSVKRGKRLVTIMFFCKLRYIAGIPAWRPDSPEAWPFRMEIHSCHWRSFLDCITSHATGTEGI